MSDIAPLREFVVGMTQLVARDSPEGALLSACGELLASLVADDRWLPAEFSAGDPDRYCQYLLHCDPLERFSVVSFVWKPGQLTPIHNHRTWGAIGQLRGIEESTRYERDTLTGRLTRGQTSRLEPGGIEFVSPRLGDIHQVRNLSDAETAISIHVYGANIGALRRQAFDPQTGEAREFVSGYSSDRVPNLWDRSRES